MRIISVLIAATLLFPVFDNSVYAQEEPSKEPYKLALYVQGKKGKPYKGSKIMINVMRTAEMYEVPANGLLYIPGILDDDQLYVYDGSKMFSIEVGGFDSLNVVFNSPGKIKGVYKNEKFNTGYGEISKARNTEAYATVDMKYAETYSNLLDYLKGRVAGLEVIGNTIRIRGTNSINSSTEPMVVVDGIMMDLQSANLSVLPREIESITVDKTGAMYGVRGANGVIIIKTRTSIGD